MNDIAQLIPLVFLEGDTPFPPVTVRTCENDMEIVNNKIQKIKKKFLSEISEHHDCMMICKNQKKNSPIFPSKNMFKKK